MHEMKTAQKQSAASHNVTGIPTQMKQRYEAASGLTLDDVHIHYHSDKPAQLQALAYTQGDHVYIGPGQEKHLGHELGHVIQQKQGEVRPTMHINGIPVNDDRGMERKADLWGGRANAVQCMTEASPRQKKTQGGTAQRMIGFEFETGWLVQAPVDYDAEADKASYTPVFGEKKEVIDKPFLTQSENRQYAHLRKKNLVYCHNDFTVEADEADEGKAELEFVTKPRDTKAEVESTMDALVKTAKQIEDAAGSRCSPFTWKGFIISPCNWIGMCDNESKPVLAANPQATFGMPLNRLGTLKPDMMDRRTTHSHLDGLVGLMKEYIRKGTQTQSPFFYPKMIADNVMARTDFAALFQLAVEEDGIDKPGIIKWKRKFNGFLNDNNLKYDTLLFRRGVYDEDEATLANNSMSVDTAANARYLNQHTYYPPLKVGEWIKGIQKGKDLLAQIKDHEGLGEYGERTDTVEGHRVGIFEHRELVRINSNLPLSEWKPFALSQYDEVEQLLGRTPVRTSAPARLRMPASQSQILTCIIVVLCIVYFLYGLLSGGHHKKE